MVFALATASVFIAIGGGSLSEKLLATENDALDEAGPVSTIGEEFSSAFSIIAAITLSLTPAFFNSTRPDVETSNFICDVAIFFRMISGGSPARVISSIDLLSIVSVCPNAGSA